MQTVSTNGLSGDDWQQRSRGIRGLVAKRLLIAWALLSLAVGGLVALLEVHRVDNLALDLAISSSEPLRSHITQIGEQHVTSLKAALTPLIRQGYLHAQVTDKSGMVMAEVSVPDQAELLTRFKRREPVSQMIANASHQIFWMTGQLIAQVSFPLLDRSGNTVGTFHGLYQVDTATREHAQMELVRNVSVTLIAILMTSLALYPVIIGLNKGVLQLSVGLMRGNIELMEVLGSAIAKRDSDTDLHNYRVCLYSIRFAEALGLSKKQIQTVITGAFLHDAGKIGISDAILLKPGKLTAEEFSAMKTHVQLGTEIIAKSSWLESAREVMEFHHERFDGSGYLAGLKGESIPLVARLFAIVDVFDALTSRRPYKEPLHVVDAMSILAGSGGSHFDPRLLAVFEKIGTALHMEVSRLTETELRERLHDQVTKYFFDGKASYRSASKITKM